VECLLFNYVHLVHLFPSEAEREPGSMNAMSGIAVLIALAAGGLMLWVWAILRMSTPLSDHNIEHGSKTDPKAISARSNSKVEI